ncbi:MULTISPECIES: hypothetical protein [Subtercola]|uniref:Uncharacterized protein n=1 Tax=Subtercola vilae TaxID=2056433 RepID=A0A4T2C4T1_9MICO|nr:MULTISPECIES: hypothetical protein [Subtercola]MEA9984067.1 hypothetical protein [Subtercola sp. RTI3]TIH38709.1 hypothetical protein D4765_06350 [Subtercola vilae]
MPIVKRISPLSAAAQNTPTSSYSRIVRHGGNQYFATTQMAEIFRTHADEIVAENRTELVPLLHSTGVELLLVSPSTVFAVVAIEVGRLSAV